MRFGLSVARGIAAILLSGVVAGACSAGGGGKNDGTGNTASKNGTGGTLMIGMGGSTGGSITVGGGTAGGDGNPVLTMCTKTADCPTGDVCVLTPNGGLCSPNGGPCT